MAKYKIQYAYERWYEVEVEAENEEKAWETFHRFDFDNEKYVGGELQADATIEEISNA